MELVWVTHDEKTVELSRREGGIHKDKVRELETDNKNKNVRYITEAYMNLRRIVKLELPCQKTEAYMDLRRIVKLELPCQKTEAYMNLRRIVKLELPCQKTEAYMNLRRIVKLELPCQKMRTVICLQTSTVFSIGG
jgi:hypothetical protein